MEYSISINSHLLRASPCSFYSRSFPILMTKGSLKFCTFIVDRITHLMTDSADSVRKIAKDSRFIDFLKIVYNFSKRFLK